MSANYKPKGSRTDRDEVAAALPEAPTRVTRVSRQRMRAEVFRHDWDSISDTERAARAAAISAPAMPEGPAASPNRLPRARQSEVTKSDRRNDPLAEQRADERDA